MKLDLPIIADFINTANRGDTKALLATFTDDAMLNDKHRFFLGKDAIGKWAAAEFTGPGVSIEVIEQFQHYDDIILTVNFGGGFDKAGFDTFTVNSSIVVLHGPMQKALHALYFTLRDSLIGTLMVTPIDGSSPIRTDGAAFYVPSPSGC